MTTAADYVKIIFTTAPTHGRCTICGRYKTPVGACYNRAHEYVNKDVPKEKSLGAWEKANNLPSFFE